MRKRIKRYISPFLKYFFNRYTKKPRKFNYKGVYTVVSPEVFPPKYTLSTKILLEYLNDKDIKGESVLELGCGSGIISLFAAKKGALVTATDINSFALSQLAISAQEQKFKIEIIESNLFESLNGKQFDLIIINPPYYPKEPKTIREKAWFCGANFEYFEKLFSTLGPFQKDGNTKIILSDDCKINTIVSIANKHGYKMETEIFKKSILETNTLFQINKV